MVEKDIINALKHCVGRPINLGCSGCLLNKVPNCRAELLKNSLDLIDHQNAEIKELRKLFIRSGKEQDRLMAEIERLEKHNISLMNELIGGD